VRFIEVQVALATENEPIY